MRLHLNEPRRHPRPRRHFLQPRVGGPVGRRSRRAVFEVLRQRGIGVNVHDLPVHTQPYYQALVLANSPSSYAWRRPFI
jgi:dTDP-4-amino-4,6-dideoxygalactose transaminase